MKFIVITNIDDNNFDLIVSNPNISICKYIKNCNRITAAIFEITKSNNLF